jgi:hypothetical protein
MPDRPASEPSGRARAWRAAEGAAVLAAAGLFLHLASFRDGDFVYQFHKAGTGAWIDEGLRVADGGWPYRDSDIRLGPGLPLLGGALVAVFGRSLDVHAWAGWALGCALAAALFALASTVAPRGWRLVPPLTFAALVYAPHDLGSPRWPALLLVLLALRALAGTARSRAAVAGACCGFASAFAPAIGLAATAGIAAHLARSTGPAPTFLAVALAATAAVFAPLAAAADAGAVARGWSLAIVEPLRTVSLGRWTATGVGQALFAAVGIAGAIATLRDPGAGDRARLVALAGLAVVATAPLGHLDPYALAVLATPLAAASVSAAGRATRARGPWRAAIAVLIACAAIAGASIVVWRQRVAPLVREEFRAGAAWIGAPNVELPWLAAQTAPGEATFVFPAGGGSYLLTATRNATSLPFAIDGLTSEEAQARALAEIAAARPRVGVWMGSQRFDPGPGRPRLDLLYDGILKGYRAERSLPDGTLLLRRAD